MLYPLAGKKREKRKMAKILVVEDDDALGKVVKTCLQRFGHEVTCAMDGLSASQILEREPFELMITDLVMPEVEGIELIRRAKGWYPELPIIAISGGGRNEPLLYLQMARKFGASSGLAKPFTPAQLKDAVDSLLPNKEPEIEFEQM
jgi:CheY-like chemotaxis protein